MDEMLARGIRARYSSESVSTHRRRDRQLLPNSTMAEGQPAPALRLTLDGQFTAMSSRLWLA